MKYYRSDRERAALTHARKLASVDIGRAREEIRALVARESFVSAFEFAMMLWFGDGCGEDRIEAKEWLRLAADNEIASAQFFYGMIMYHDGQLREFSIYLWRAVELGYPPAAYSLGVILLNGTNGRFKDYEVGRSLLEKAQRLGHFWAEFAIGWYEMKGYFGVSAKLSGCVKMLRSTGHVCRIALLAPANYPMKPGVGSWV
ncbi:MAG: hypothetical protein WDN04_27670 [Rhodospirillales bacterium]